MTEAMETLDDRDEELLRQVNPTWIHDGDVSSQAFRPTPKDKQKLSTDRGSLSTAEESYDRYVAQELASVGVWAVTVGECQDIDLTVHPDPDPDGQDNPAHAFVYFGDLSTNKTKKKSQVLGARARDRGCLYRPPVSSEANHRG